MNEPIAVNEYISLFPPREEPLSSDVVLIKTNTGYCIYDVGNNKETAKYINDLDGQKTVVISHFHIDHTSMLDTLEYDTLYVGKKTYDIIGNAKSEKEKRLNNPKEYVPNNVLADGHTEPGIGDYDSLTAVDFDKTVIVRENFSIDDGVKLDVLLFPSTHSKGSLVLMVNEEIAFLGDSLYAKFKDDSKAYNVQLLKEQIQIIEAMPAKSFLLSHDRGKVRSKAFVLRLLNSIYGQRTPDSPYVYMG